jgi:hypothetical protein
MTFDPDGDWIVCVTRSPLDHRVWVPIVAGMDVYSAVYAGPLRRVKEHCEVHHNPVDGPVKWVRDGDDWLLTWA